MSHLLNAVGQVDQKMRDCIAACSQCGPICAATTEHCLRMGGEHAAADHIRTLTDCAQACDTSRDFMLRGSELHPRLCGACAEACERCAESCERIGGDDQLIRQCAEICRRCADSCRQVAGPAG